MATAPEFTLTQAAPGQWALSGRVLFANAAQVLAAGERAFAGEPAPCLDLAGVVQMDSGGLAVLLEWLRGARAAGQQLRLTRVPAQALAIARLSGADGFLRAAGP